MEPLWKLLGVTQGLTAVIGSGGKTSLLYELAEELRPCGTVLLATTTHIMKPPSIRLRRRRSSWPRRWRQRAWPVQGASHRRAS